ncbi:hypothetical protein Salat_1098800 [Sesamum alatum]|uniref:Uncharacterized protein n=1 Tax=Sesamum alatum TaxID=300844 RepID=A0AAE1YMX0_9LAMI|nr:hypothetical protein Salat_1098800 [Sesamum alatum]
MGCSAAKTEVRSAAKTEVRSARRSLRQVAVHRRKLRYVRRQKMEVFSPAKMEVCSSAEMEVLVRPKKWTSPFACLKSSGIGGRRSSFVAVRLPQVVGQWLGFLHSLFAVRGSPLAVRGSPLAVRRSPFSVRRSLDLGEDCSLDLGKS